jgi:hypothetical protein
MGANWVACISAAKVSRERLPGEVPQVQMHELGHNFGLSMPGDSQGGHAACDGFPHKCQCPNHWLLGWFSDRSSVDPNVPKKRLIWKLLGKSCSRN